MLFDESFMSFKSLLSSSIFTPSASNSFLASVTFSSMVFSAVVPLADILSISFAAVRLY